MGGEDRFDSQKRRSYRPATRRPEPKRSWTVLRKAEIARPPGERRPLAELCSDIGKLAKQSVDDDAEQNDIGLEEFTGVQGHEADAGRSGDGLRHDQGEPHDPQPVAQPDEDGGKRAWQYD